MEVTLKWKGGGGLDGLPGHFRTRIRVDAQRLSRYTDSFHFRVTPRGSLACVPLGQRVGRKRKGEAMEEERGAVLEHVVTWLKDDMLVELIDGIRFR